MSNAVKHFKWEPRGKRRLHRKPNTAEVIPSPLAPHVTVTVHPYSILRATDAAARRAAMAVVPGLLLAVFTARSVSAVDWVGPSR